MNLQELYDMTAKLHWHRSKDSITSCQRGRTVVEILGPNTSVKRINSASFVALRAELVRRGLSGATINRYLAALRRMVGVAVQSGLMAAVPSYSKQREGEPRSATLSRDKEWAFLCNHRSARHAALTQFLLYTGLRLGEALALRQTDIKEDSVCVRNTKSNRARTIPLNRKASEALGGRTFEDIKVASYRADFRHALSKCGLASSGLVIHSLRHTFASRLLGAGVNLFAIQNLLGHSSVVTTQRYAHLDASQFVSAVFSIEGT